MPAVGGKVRVSAPLFDFCMAGVALSLGEDPRHFLVIDGRKVHIRAVSCGSATRIRELVVPGQVDHSFCGQVTFVRIVD
jgi:hypothetical protein